MRSPPRTMERVSTPSPRRALTAPLSDGVGGQLGDEGGVHAVVGQRHGYIGLAAAEGGLQLIVLKEAVVAVGASRSMISPKVTIRLLIVIPPYLRTR